LWDTWSKGSDKYDPDVTGLKWDTFTPGAGVTLNSIFRDAIDAGWTPPRNREPKQAGTSTSVDTGAGGTIEMSYRNDNLPARVDSEPVALPTIKVRPELNAVTDEALQAIGAAKLGVYVRGRQLVEVVRDGTEAPAWIKRPPGAPSISRIDKARVSGLLDTSGRYTKHVRREKIDVPITPPAWIAEQILSRPSWPLPYLEGIIEAPTLRPDGSILCTPGHDEATGLLYIPPPGADAWPAIPEDPDERQLREAVAALMEPFADFPFVSGTDKSACLAAVLTIIGRPMIRGPVPMFVVEAPTPATGKSLCAEAVIALATGLEPSTTSLPHSEAELQKRVLAIAEGGYPVVLLDNISGTVGSDTLAAALTTTTWQGRRLGATEEVVVPLRAVWIATGNNPHYKATLGRRVVPIRLDAKQEHPEDRGGFRHPDLLAFVRKERPRLVAAALTILRAFHVAGRPHHGKPRMGSYNAWDDLVRSALVMAGQDDPAATDNPQSGRGRIRAQSDDDLNTLAVALAEMHRVIGDEKVTSSAILKAASDQSVAGDDRLRDALEAWATDRAGRLTPKSLGMKASTVDGRQVGGLVLRSVKDLGYPTRISIEVRAPAGEE
jgi:putative DNA primase/helicase